MRGRPPNPEGATKVAVALRNSLYDEADAVARDAGVSLPELLRIGLRRELAIRTRRPGEAAPANFGR